MVFSSLVFLFAFLPCVIFGYYFISARFRNIFLAFASLFFYFWGEPKFLLIMLLSIFINYFYGLCLAYHFKSKYFSRNQYKKFILILAIFSNLGILFYFKYVNFFIENINEVLNINIALQSIVLPIGISFFTFQGMTYIIDLYWGKVEVQNSLIKVALYISLFPQLVAGPIVRYKDIAHQIDYRKFDIDLFTEGVERFIIGLGKKVLIANNLGVIVDSIFSQDTSVLSTAVVWLGIIGYTFQIYFDFSGYSDMAIGLGRMFGFRFLENFNYPYISKSISEFWRRWHMSLSSFFKDYVYIPLGGNREGNVYLNLMIVFFITGLWHGAAWNFIIWGIWHGVFVIIEKVVKIEMKGGGHLLNHIYTMLVVMIGWVFFRSETLVYAFEYLKIMFGLAHNHQVAFSISYYIDSYALFILSIAVLFSLDLKAVFSNFQWNVKFIVVKYLCLICLFIFSIIALMTSTYNPFIYFRF